MPTATWNGVVIAQARAEEVHIVENNVYFPISAVRMEFLLASAHTSVCGWKGSASYFDLVVDGKVNFDAAWIYREPLPGARQIEGHMAFWRGVSVQP